MAIKRHKQILIDRMCVPCAMKLLHKTLLSELITVIIIKFSMEYILHRFVRRWLNLDRAHCLSNQRVDHRQQNQFKMHMLASIQHTKTT